MTNETSSPAPHSLEGATPESTISPAAAEIMHKRPASWELRLFARVLADECRKVAAIPKSSFLPVGSNFERMEIIAFPRWAVDKQDAFLSLYKNVAAVIDMGELAEACGPPGQPGDATKLVKVARHLADHYQSAVELTCVIELTEVDPLVQNAAYEMAGVGRSNHSHPVCLSLLNWSSRGG